MEEFTPTLTSLLLKGAAILLLASIVVLFLRRHSAAARHLVWAAAVTGMLVLPFLSLLLPTWSPVSSVSVAEIPRDFSPGQSPAPFIAPANTRPVNESVSDEFLDTASPPRETPENPAIASDQSGPRIAESPTATTSPIWTSVLRWAPWIWLGGTAIALTPLFLGWFGLFLLKKTARPVSEKGWTEVVTELQLRLRIGRRVRLVTSSACRMPMTWGSLPGGAATIVVAEEAVTSWSDGRRRAVLLHELAHVKRWDCLTQTLTRIACALHWCNPLIWFAANRMLVERERACDDLALLHQTKPSEYADHLLEIAAAPRTAMFADHAAVAMARTSRLGDRVAAILDRRRKSR